MLIILIFLIIGALFLATTLWATSKNISKEDYKNGYTWEFKKPPTRKKKSYNIITYNIGFASGMANNLPVKKGKKFYSKNLLQITKAIQSTSPDFIALQEADIDSSRSFSINQVKYIAEKTKSSSAAFLPTWSKNYIPYPYWPPAVHYGKINSGQAVISKHKITKQIKYPLPKPESNSLIYNAFYLEKIIQKTTLQVEDTELIIFNVHLEAFDKKNRNQQVKKLMQLYKKVKDKPVLIVGDFNATPPYATSSGEFDSATIEKILVEKSLKTAITKKEYQQNEQKHFTHPSNKPTVKLDHIFYNKKIKPLKAQVLKKAGSGSDHLPLFFEFSIKQ